MGSRKAREFLFTGEPMPARMPLNAGWSTGSSRSSELDEAVNALAHRVAQAPPFAAAILKRVLNRTLEAQGFGCPDAPLRFPPAHPLQPRKRRVKGRRGILGLLRPQQSRNFGPVIPRQPIIKERNTGNDRSGHQRLPRDDRVVTRHPWVTSTSSGSIAFRSGTPSIWTCAETAGDGIRRDGTGSEDVRVGVFYAHGEHFPGGLDMAKVGNALREGRGGIPEAG